MPDSILNADPNNNSAYNNLPTFAKVAAIVGIPGALAFLVFFAFYQLVGSAATEHQVALTSHVATTQAQDARLGEFMDAHERHEELVRQILIQLCVQAAPTALDRKACIPAGN